MSSLEAKRLAHHKPIDCSIADWERAIDARPETVGEVEWARQMAGRDRRIPWSEHIEWHAQGRPSAKAAAAAEQLVEAEVQEAAAKLIAQELVRMRAEHKALLEDCREGFLKAAGHHIAELKKEFREKADRILAAGIMGVPAVDMASVTKRLDAFENRLGEISRGGFRYRGTWAPGNYTENDSVTHDGSLFICRCETTDKPATTGAWTLAVKRGRDGRDAAR